MLWKSVRRWRIRRSIEIRKRDGGREDSVMKAERKEANKSSGNEFNWWLRTLSGTKAESAKGAIEYLLYYYVSLLYLFISLFVESKIIQFQPPNFILRWNIPDMLISWANIFQIWMKFVIISTQIHQRNEIVVTLKLWWKSWIPSLETCRNICAQVKHENFTNGKVKRTVQTLICRNVENYSAAEISNKNFSLQQDPP